VSFKKVGFELPELPYPGTAGIALRSKFPALLVPLLAASASTCDRIHARMRRISFRRRSGQAGHPHKSRLGTAAIGMLVLSMVLFAQEKPVLTMEHDCQTFAIANNNKIVCSVPRLKRIKKIIITRDDVWLATPNGHEKQIVEGEKFMPVPPPSSYTVDLLAWSPDGGRLAMNMTTQRPSSEDEPAGGAKVIALLDDDGHEIKVEGSKTRFIENATNGTWLADDATVVYLTGIGPYQIVRVRPSDGRTTPLFAGHTFDAVAWDAKNNRAFALGQNLSVLGRLALVELDLLRETVREVARVDMYQGELSVSPSGKKIAFFEDGDTLEVRDLANPSKPIRVRAGYGRYQWSRDEKRVLLKRGPVDKSNDLVWVGLYDESFVPALHDLEFHAFAIAPDGGSLAVTQPGKGVLKVYPLQ
jgi:hypothetical protein